MVNLRSNTRTSATKTTRATRAPRADIKVTRTTRRNPNKKAQETHESPVKSPLPAPVETPALEPQESPVKSPLPTQSAAEIQAPIELEIEVENTAVQVLWSLELAETPIEAPVQALVQAQAPVQASTPAVEIEVENTAVQMELAETPIQASVQAPVQTLEQSPVVERPPVERLDLVLGQIDAHLTDMFIDNEGRKSHKYCEKPDNFFALIGRDKKTQKLGEDMMKSYASSMDYINYVDKVYGVEIQMCIQARKALPRSWIITGLDGYLADMPENDDVPQFSVFKFTTKTGETTDRIMLGPASFANHSCKPNAEFFAGGESKGKTIIRIRTTREILRMEEIFVDYGPDFFGPGNKDCLCENCIGSVKEQQSHSSGYGLRRSEVPSEVIVEDCDENIDVYVLPDPNESRNPPKKEKRVKFGQLETCPICETTCKRIDKHLNSCHPELSKNEQVMLRDYIRTKGAHANRKIWYCETHCKQFADKSNHKRYYKCAMDRINEIEDHQSKKCLPLHLRLKLRNSVLASEKHLELTEQYLLHTYHLKNGTAQLEEGLSQVHAQKALKLTLAILFGNTLALTKPRALTTAINRYVYFLLYFTF